MRHLAVLSSLVLIAASLAGCNTGAPQGVLPRTAVPPPPSVAGRDAKPSTRADRVDAAVRRRALSVPARLDAPRPSAISPEPVMTPSGVGAGFRF